MKDLARQSVRRSLDESAAGQGLAIALRCLAILLVGIVGRTGDGAPADDTPSGKNAANAGAERKRGVARVEETRPARFPHRIWAASDFEVRTPDYGWFGPPETKNIPRYPGNATALGVGERPYGKTSAVMTGMNPVPGPCMGKVNKLYLRYFLTGATEATFQHFSLTREDNSHLRVSGLTEGRWSELALNFTRDARRNDGSPEPFAEGERMDDFKVFAGKPGDGTPYQLLIDDVVFYSEDPALPPVDEPFPNRVIYLAAFDTGPKEKYWPGEFELVRESLPAGSYWAVARAVQRKDSAEKMISLPLEPPRTVGACTKLRFRYHLRGTDRLRVQIFDLTDQDNRHLDLERLKENEWTFTILDFTRDSRKNDGHETPFAAGHKVDDIFFFVTPRKGEEATLLVDEVALFDAGER